MTPTFYEFFAGGGMARAGMGPDWTCLLANDIDEKKGRSYAQNWGTTDLRVADVATLSTIDAPGSVDLAWASFPCQDLSLAGNGAGLSGSRSGTFLPFWHLMRKLIAEDRAPRVIALENVCGALTSHDGSDFSTICGLFHQSGYLVGAMVIDAAVFLPQSRPRLFIVGVSKDLSLPSGLQLDRSALPWHTRSLVGAQSKLSSKVKRDWIWWNLPSPPARTVLFEDLIEDNPSGVKWFSKEQTVRLLSMMSDVNREKLAIAQREQRRIVGGVYRRTRPTADGTREQRAEVRFDGLSGCLRTPAGGSSRQVILVVEGKSVRARLVSARETARLMGLPDTYLLPNNYNDAYHLTGDGVAVPVVRHLAAHLFEPILQASQPRKTAAA